ncbi:MULTISPECIES: hypothetical protein [unclassified Microbulbifer]|uniref:hypothetical protein n=1 Tax=unclassified Microbulbifer TaxID=2619833 RepID=UPI0027E49C11|nr:MULTISPECIES: hypothetical protein [unclassified Microbulbifer]
MMIAVCIKCGTLKRGPAVRCPKCRFEPLSPEDKAKSLILSMAYEIEGEYRGKSKNELIAISEAIQAGRPYAFDEAEVRLVVEYAEKVLSLFPKRIGIDGLKWLLPPLAVLAILYLLLFYSS